MKLSLPSTDPQKAAGEIPFRIWAKSSFWAPLPLAVSRVAGAYSLLKCSNGFKILHSPSPHIRKAYAKAPASFEDSKVVILTRVEGSDFRVFSPAPVGFSVGPP